MRVLTVGNMYPPHSRGGYEVAWQSAVRFLRSRGHDVRVLTTTFSAPGREDAPEDPEIYRELGWYWRDDAWPRFSGVDRLRLERSNARTLKSHLRDHRSEVVCWWAMGGMSLSLIERVRRYGIPAVFVICDDWLVYGPEVDAWMRAMRRVAGSGVLERLTGIPTTLDLSDAGEWIFLSETTRDRARVTGWSFGGSVVSPIGPSTDLFGPRPPSDWSWRLLYVGRIDPRKGISLAIDALALLPEDATLAIEGSGDESHILDLRERVRQRGLEHRVTFSHHGRDQLEAVYADADVVLFPVLWEEPWGLVPLEAMTVGTPVIASGRGGSGEYLRDEENCLIVQPDNGPEELARAVQRLAADEQLRSRLRAGGFETSSRFPADGFDRVVEEKITQATLGGAAKRTTATIEAAKT